MKASLLALALLTMASARPAAALPILTRNAPGAETVTIFPDHQDPNLYYLAPTAYTVAKDPTGLPNFSYMEYRHRGALKAIVQTTMHPDFTLAAMESAKQRILQGNPAARFAALPFSKASVAFTGSLAELVELSDCQHPAGTVGDEQTCAFRLNRQGARVIGPMLRKGLAITMQFIYSVDGVAENTTGFVNQTNTLQLGGRIGGPELAAHPELFQDRHGRNVRPLLGPAETEIQSWSQIAHLDPL